MHVLNCFDNKFKYFTKKLHYVRFVSSPEQNAQWELLGHRDVRRPSSIVRSFVVNNFFKEHLLLNYLANFNQTS